MPHVSKLKWSLTCGKNRSSRPGRRTRASGAGVISIGKTDNRHCHPVRHNPAWEWGAEGTQSALPVLLRLAEGSGPARLVGDPAQGLEKLVECSVHGRAGALAKEEGQAEGSDPRSKGDRQKDPARNTHQERRGRTAVAGAAAAAGAATPTP